MRASHLLFALGIEDLVAVDHAGAGDADIVKALADDEAVIPARLAPGIRVEACVGFDVHDADEPCALGQMEFGTAPESERSGQIASFGEEHLAVAGRTAGVDGLLDRLGVDRLTVAARAEIADVEWACGRVGGESDGDWIDDHRTQKDDGKNAAGFHHDSLSVGWPVSC